MATETYEKLYNSRDYPDVIFVFGGKEEKAHREVLAKQCDHFKKLFDENRDTRIPMKDTSFKIFKEVIKYCYLQRMDIGHWSYKKKMQLCDLANKYNYGPLINIAKSELEKSPKVELSAESLNECYEYCPEEKIRAWVERNVSKIINYEDCHKYSKGLIAFILDALIKAYDQETDRHSLQKQVLHWLFRWRNDCNRKEEDVQSIYDKVKRHLVLSRYFHDSIDIAQWNQSKKTPKPVEAVLQFWRHREVDTSGWTCDEVLLLLRLAYEYNLNPFVDAVVKAVGAKYLDSSTFAKIHDLALALESNKLEEVMVGYLRDNTKSLLTNVEFANYPVSVTEFILEHLKGQMTIEMKKQLLNSLWNWKASKSEEEVIEVYCKVHWEDFTRRELARVLRWLIPFTRLAEISHPPTSARNKAVKRKHDNDSPGRKRGRPPKV